MTWTYFKDMHSGGGRKLGAEIIWIEAPEDEATELFEQIFGRDPDHVTCTCCGADYSYWEPEGEPEFEAGDLTVSAADIERFRSEVRKVMEAVAAQGGAS